MSSLIDLIRRKLGYSGPFSSSVTEWQIGPIINGKNYSVKMPLHPSVHPEGFQTDFPYPNKAAGHIHYVTKRTGSLAGKSRMILRGRIEAEEGVKFIPQEFQDRDALMALYIQRRGEEWDKSTPFHRFWSAVRPIVQAGEINFIHSFDNVWTSTYGKPSNENIDRFKAALNNAERIGFTFGHYGGSGHGIFATGKAKLIVTHFGVE